MLVTTIFGSGSLRARMAATISSYVNGGSCTPRRSARVKLGVGLAVGHAAPPPASRVRILAEAPACKRKAAHNLRALTGLEPLETESRAERAPCQKQVA